MRVGLMALSRIRYAVGAAITATSGAGQQSTSKPAIPVDPIPAIVEAFRAVNATLPQARRLRVLLGDPPIDWSQVRGCADHFRWLGIGR